MVQIRSSSPQLGNTSKISFTRYAATGAQLATSVWPISAGACYRGSQPDSILATSDGGYVVTSAVHDQSVQHPFALVKMDAALQREWFTDWNGYPGGVHLAPTLDGWFVVCGLPPLPYPAGTETWLVRPDTDGSVQPPA